MECGNLFPLSISLFRSRADHANMVPGGNALNGRTAAILSTFPLGEVWTEDDPWCNQHLINFSNRPLEAKMLKEAD
jgi:hypothetical protein